MNDFIRHISSMFMLATAFAMSGCANPVMQNVANTMATHAKVQLPPLAQKPAAELPVKDGYKESGNGKRFSLTVKDADIVGVLLMLSKESGVPIIAENGVSGSVSVTIDKKPLGEVLYAVIKPLGYTATVENGIIFVGLTKLETRTFRINYMKDKRETRSNTNVSVLSGSNAGSTGSGSSYGSSYGSSSGSDSGNVNVTTSGSADFWGSIESALEIMVFGTTSGGKREASSFVRGEDAGKTSVGVKSPEPRDKKLISIQMEAADTSLSANEQLTISMLAARLGENRRKHLLVNELAGIIQITDYPDNLNRITRFLEDVERSIKRQVLIQTHIMEITLNDSFSMGINWSVIAGDLTITQGLVPLLSANAFKIAATTQNFTGLIEAMKEQGNVNMLSSPKVIAMNNQKAVIKLTTKEVSWITQTTYQGTLTALPITTTIPQIDEVGIFLDVTPQIDETGKITMHVHPSVSEVKRISVSPDRQSNKPVINVREIDTMIDARSGETIVIAGLIADKLHESKRSVPLLGDIPYLGALFAYNEQNREKTELVILLTPFYLNQASIEDIRKEHEKRMQSFGDTFHLINNLGSLVTEQSSRKRLIPQGSND